MQQPPPQSLIGPASQPSRSSGTQVQPPVVVTEADRIAWMRRFLAALDLWKRCLDSATPSFQGSAPKEEASAQTDPPWKRQRVETIPQGPETQKAITEVS
ncbi:unnamed protein product [Symbiodinium natans]|uniref:Uncharacterized protein n=1 Tax=Symbiodinium natans TaxID=878477 RepID=A0A812TP13_9DINO|nr:unnamed protein product [Symbiodinium natans]